MRAAIKKGEAIEVTLRNYRKNGELFYNRLDVKPLLDDRGNIVYYLGVQYDVTSQIEAQQEIQSLTQQLKISAK